MRMPQPGCTHARIPLHGGPGPFHALAACVIGRSSGFEASRHCRFPTDRRFPAPAGASAYDGGRSSLPLRGSPGFSPGSLLRHWRSCQRTNDSRTISTSRVRVNVCPRVSDLAKCPALSVPKRKMLPSRSQRNRQRPHYEVCNERRCRQQYFALDAAGRVHRPPRGPGGCAQLWPILAAVDVVLTGEAEMSLNDFLGDWEGTDLETETLVILGPDGTPVAYADIDHRADVAFYIYAYVDPTHWGTGLDDCLTSWGERFAQERATNAPEGARIVARAFVNEKHAEGIRMIEARGYQPVRVTYTMKIDLAEPPPAPNWPDGLTVRTFVPGQDDQSAFEANEAAFADMWQRPPGALERFLSMQGRPYFDPNLWFLALDGDNIAGTLFAADIDGSGWIENVGVLRPWRRRGVALAMLQHAFRALYERGVTRIGLSVDAQSPTGAPRLYERAGMGLDQSYRLYELELLARIRDRVATGRSMTRPIRLIATDLDGTLLRSDRTVSQRTRDTVARAQTAGITFVIATARHPTTAAMYAAEAGITGLAICANGALVYDLARGEIVQRSDFPAESARAMIERLKIDLPDVTFALIQGMDFVCEPAYATLSDSRDHGRDLELAVRPDLLAELADSTHETHRPPPGTGAAGGVRRIAALEINGYEAVFPERRSSTSSGPG